jgi:hypothetical protein
MKKQFANTIFTLPHIIIILSVLLMMGCGSMESISIKTLDMIIPASMSPTVGVNPNQKYQEVRKFSAITHIREPGDSLVGRIFGGSRPFMMGPPVVVTNPLSKQMVEAMRGSEGKAIKDIEVNMEFASWFYIGVLLKGSVIETP